MNLNLNYNTPIDNRVKRWVYINLMNGFTKKQIFDILLQLHYDHSLIKKFLNEDYEVPVKT